MNAQPTLAEAFDLEGRLLLTNTQIASECVAVLGARGSGKSNDLALILKQLASEIPFVVIDTHGEYGPLGRALGIPVVGVGGKTHAVDLEIVPEQMTALADGAYGARASVIIDLLMVKAPQRLEYVYPFLVRLFELAKEAPTRQFYGVVIEEAQNYIPETKQRSPVLEELAAITLEGRKFGLSIILASQRAALVSKTILGQCALVFLHGAYISNDIEQYKGMLPYSLSETRALVLGLETGQAIVRYKKQVGVYQMRRSDYGTAGATPQLDSGSAAAVDRSEQIERLRVALAAVPAAEKTVAPSTDAAVLIERLRNAEDRQEKAETFNAQIQRQSDELEHENKRLKAEIERLKHPVTKPNVVLVSNHAKPDDCAPLPTQRGLGKQERAFAGLLHDILHLPNYQQLLLRWLAEREGQAFALRDITRYLGVALTTLQDHPPTQLMSRGVLVRTGKGMNATYRSVLSSHLSANFPDLDQEELMIKLLSRLPRLR